MLDRQQIVGIHYIPRSKSFLSCSCAQVYTKELPKACCTFCTCSTKEVEKLLWIEL